MYGFGNLMSRIVLRSFMLCDVNVSFKTDPKFLTAISIPSNTKNDVHFDEKKYMLF